MAIPATLSRLLATLLLTGALLALSGCETILDRDRIDPDGGQNRPWGDAAHWEDDPIL